MSRWNFTPAQGELGRFAVYVYPAGGQPREVTYFRDTPVIISGYANADPFGDATAQLVFPQITGFDDLRGDECSWLQAFAQVEIYWVPMQEGSTEIDPRTNTITLDPVHTGRSRVFEGFIASLDVSVDDTGSSLSVQCQGSAFQADRYMAKPSFPSRPIPHETLLTRAFSHTDKPHLRTKPLRIDWPKGWKKIVPAYTTPNAYTPDARPGAKYSGYSTRDTGGWVHALTDHAAGLLATMFVDDESGVTPGNQWTIRVDPGRQPVLYVRDRFKTPDIELWYGQPGVSGSFSYDATQVANIIYGTGTAVDGSGWSNQIISNDGRNTGYAPLAYDPAVYGPAGVGSPGFNKNGFAAESKHEFMSGFGLDQAIEVAKKSLVREREANWTGELTITLDPPQMSRWQIRAGMTLKLKGFMGTGDSGMNFHIAQVQANPSDGTVALTLDTRYRGLAELEESRARMRDPLTPTKMLRVGQRSIILEDIAAPWDYTAGSGFIPLNSVKAHNVRPVSSLYPWKDFLKSHPPRRYGSWYVRVKANAAKRADRWTLGRDLPILMSQKGTIRRVEIVCCDVDGNILKIPFHFSLYYVAVTVSAMPRDGNGPSPFIENAFERIDKRGMQVPSTLWPEQTLIQGWGNKDQPAGYTPGRKSDGASPTGMLVDESTWTFDMTNNPNFAKNARPGVTIPKSVVTAYGSFYAEHTQPVYFMGRMYRSEPGA